MALNNYVVVGKRRGQQAVDRAIKTECHLSAAHRRIVGIFGEDAVGGEKSVHVAPPPFQQSHRPRGYNALQGHSYAAFEMRTQDVARGHIQGQRAVGQSNGIGSGIYSRWVGHKSHAAGEPICPKHCQQSRYVALASGSDTARIEDCQRQTSGGAQAREQVEAPDGKRVKSVALNNLVQSGIQT